MVSLLLLLLLMTSLYRFGEQLPVYKYIDLICGVEDKEKAEQAAQRDSF